MASDVVSVKRAWNNEDLLMIEQLLGPSAVAHLSWSLQGLTPAGGRRLNEAALQQRLQSLVEGSAVNWTYAIFWQLSSTFKGDEVLGWGDGYVKEPKDKQDEACRIHYHTNHVDERLKRHVLRLLQSQFCAADDLTAIADEDFLSDTELFYLISMFYCFPRGVGVPGTAFETQNHVWLTGINHTTSSICTRASMARIAGIQTIVCVPTLNGVAELGSTDLICENRKLIHEIKVSFTEDIWKNEGLSVQGRSLVKEEAGASPPVSPNMFLTLNSAKQEMGVVKPAVAGGHQYQVQSSRAPPVDGRTFPTNFQVNPFLAALRAAAAKVFQAHGWHPKQSFPSIKQATSPEMLHRGRNNVKRSSPTMELGNQFIQKNGINSQYNMGGRVLVVLNQGNWEMCERHSCSLPHSWRASSLSFLVVSRTASTGSEEAMKVQTIWTASFLRLP